MKGKIIQITYGDGYLFALTDGGEIWSLYSIGAETQWIQVR